MPTGRMTFSAGAINEPSGSIITAESTKKLKYLKNPRMLRLTMTDTPISCFFRFLSGAAAIALPRKKSTTVEVSNKITNGGARKKLDLKEDGP